MIEQGECESQIDITVDGKVYRFIPDGGGIFHKRKDGEVKLKFKEILL